jgi:hypothetical protein
MNSPIDKQNEIQSLAIVTPDEVIDHGPDASELHETDVRKPRDFKPHSSEIFEPDAHDWS